MNMVVSKKHSVQSGRGVEEVVVGGGCSVG